MTYFMSVIRFWVGLGFVQPVGSSVLAGLSPASPLLWTNDSDGSSRVACLMGLFLGHPVMRVGDIRPAFKGSVECKTLYHAFQSTAQIR